MLPIIVPACEWFDEATNSIFSTKGAHLQLEHSLLSIYKWEQTWNKPFLGKDDKSYEEQIDYIRCMTINRDVDPIVYKAITPVQLEEINRYIEAPMTATWFKETQMAHHERKVITSEVIYYWMISLEIPFECQRWHLNSLLTLIRVCNEMNAPKKKRNRRDMLNERTALNRSRLAKTGTRG